MAATKKNKKTVPEHVNEVAPAAVMTRKQQVRLGFGTFFLLTGIFVCFAIISYFFTWKTDQDKFFSSDGLMHFLLHGPVVANWVGRLGAATAHILVYKGAGIASMAVGIVLASIGLSMVYGKKVLPLLRYLRWLSIFLLIVAPILTFLMPTSAFPFGGAWGNESIHYLNGFLGVAGTGMCLLAVAMFFVFVIFALDVKPVLKKLKKRAELMAASMRPEPVKKEAEGDKAQEKDDVVVPINNTPVENPTPASAAAENTPLPLFLNNNTLSVPEVEDTNSGFEQDEEENDGDGELELVESATPIVEKELSFEVIQQVEQPAIKDGHHISIASNEPYAPELDLPNYKYPTLDLLEDRTQETIPLDKEELEKNKNQIIQTLRSFGIEIQRISATVGPTVTLYEIVPAEGVRISKIRNLEDDIALNLAALGIRIVAPIPGRGTIGIEVPNANKQIVSMRALLSSDKFVNNKMSLPIALGKKIDNDNYIVDLATMPHLLMAGATGQGKSVGINAILVSLLYKKHPSQLKFVMVDPKKVELSIYKVIEKHFLAKLPNEEEAIITDTKKVVYTLNALCIEMDNRYELLKEAGARNLKEYNEKFIARRLNPEKGHKFLPFIVLVIDEFADLIMTAGKEVEMPIARLAQLARAVGIHLIIATQRPSVNVITGTIKANFPGRIAFKVSAKVDSRTILDAGGAEQLIGRGDMLVSHGSELLRLQCAFVDTPEVERIVEFIGQQRGYSSAFELPEYEGEEESNGKVVDLVNRDKLFEDCAKAVVQTQNGSTSNLQRRFNLGYNRAGRIMDQLEAAGIVGPAVGSKPRDVYYQTDSELEQFLSTM